MIVSESALNPELSVARAICACAVLTVSSVRQLTACDVERSSVGVSTVRSGTGVGAWISSIGYSGAGACPMAPLSGTVAAATANAPTTAIRFPRAPGPVRCFMRVSPSGRGVW